MGPTAYVAIASSQDRMFDGEMTLNIRSTSPSLTSQNYVTESYADFIILDVHFMKYFYTVFNGTNSAAPTISLYRANHELLVDRTVESDGNNAGKQSFDFDRYKLPIIVGVIILLIICSGFICRKFMNRKNKVDAGNGKLLLYGDKSYTEFVNLK